jgi:hypothetical protein
VLASYVAGVGLRDHREAVRIGKEGLRANPRDILLRNNVAVSLAVLGSIDEAEKVFVSSSVDTPQPALVATLLATRGLLRYRRGDLEQGRDFYSRALALLQVSGTKRTRALAALHLAR